MFMVHAAGREKGQEATSTLLSTPLVEGRDHAHTSKAYENCRRADEDMDDEAEGGANGGTLTEMQGGVNRGGESGLGRPHGGTHGSMAQQMGAAGAQSVGGGAAAGSGASAADDDDGGAAGWPCTEAGSQAVAEPEVLNGLASTTEMVAAAVAGGVSSQAVVQAGGGLLPEAIEPNQGVEMLHALLTILTTQYRPGGCRV